MKKLYYLIMSFILLFLITMFYDMTLYFHTYDELINIQETVCKRVSYSGGITLELKEDLLKQDMELEYKKSDDINGATFEFSIKKLVNYILFSDKYIKLDLVVILGY